MSKSRFAIDGSVFTVEVESPPTSDGALRTVNVRVTEQAPEGDVVCFDLEGVHVIRRGPGVEIVGADHRIAGAVAMGRGGEGEVCIDGERYLLRDADLLDEQGDADDTQSGPNVTAPMPGRVVKINVEPGAWVDKGHPLLVVESMKMETDIVAGIAGTVSAVQVAVGDNINPGDPLVEIESEIETAE